MGALNKLAGALALTGALSAPVEAQETAENPIVLSVASGFAAQIEDCGLFVREQRELAAEIGAPMSRDATISMIADCRGGQLAERIADQQQILGQLNDAIQQISLRVDENAQIIDENGQVIAHIITINGQLVIRRQEVQAETAASRERQQQMLDEAEQILNDLVS